MQLETYRERLSGDLWKLANEYLAFFVVECHYTPDQVYDMPVGALVNLTMLADKILDQRKDPASTPEPAPQWRRM